MAGKYYVVWEGRHPGIFENWEEARVQVENYPEAKYKSFPNLQEALEAYRRYLSNDGISLGELLVNSRTAGPAAETKISSTKQAPAFDYEAFPEIDPDAWVVDASCLGNPGVMEYRGVELKTGKEIFKVGPFRDATNNIGEFLAIVHALALMFKTGEWHTLYTDSLTGLSWVRKRAVKTTLSQTPENKKVFELIVRALNWLNTHHYEAKILKWQTEIWGEIPADFGRK